MKEMYPPDPSSNQQVRAVYKPSKDWPDLPECESLKVDTDKPTHNHYFKNVNHLHSIDVYRVCELFNVIDPCIQHALKKLLVSGGRGGGKFIAQDIQEAIDSLLRWQGMQHENSRRKQDA